jgi:pyruvate,orthophosphate dikinase
VCVCGAAALQIDYAAKTVTVDGSTYNEGDFLSINGTAGEVYAGQIPTAASEIVQVLIEKSLEPGKSQTYQNFKKLMDWCSKATRMSVRTNSDTPEQTAHAVAFGADGIGLCRTEHMFFEGNRIDAMREMILADTQEHREIALAKILPYQREDFIGIFKTLAGRPATIRFLDPPLHEFLPNTKESQIDLANKLGIAVEKIQHRVHELHEFNPMLGFRGCRLGIRYQKFPRCNPGGL